MKIKLIVTQAKGIFPNIGATHTVVNSYQEAVKVLPNCIDSKTYDYLQVVGNNKAFENNIE